MGGTPVVAVNLLGWPRDVLPAELAAGGAARRAGGRQEAGCHVGGGHSIDDPEPKYGMAGHRRPRPRPGDPQRRRRRRARRCR
jgi:selenide,water dikinase